MRRAFLHFALGISVLSTAPLAMAIGFGRTTTQATLGQPLNFAASLMLDADETVAPACVFADVYAGDAKVAPGSVRVSLEAIADGGHRVRVTTANLIDEPVVTVELSVGCASRVSRRFVVFIDPPPQQLAEAGSGDGPDMPMPRIDSQTALLSEVARDSDASRRRGSVAGDVAPEARPPIRHRTRHASRGQRYAISRAAARPSIARPAPAQAPTRLAARATLAPSASGSPRLQLEAPAPVAPSAVASEPVVAATLPVPPAAMPPLPLVASSEADSPLAALQRERDRIQILEAGLTRLRGDSLAQQRTLGAMQARLRDAESERYSNWLTYFLIGTTILFALAAAGLWWLRPRQRRRARWFDAAASQQARAALRDAGRAPASAATKPSMAPAAAAPSAAPSSWHSEPSTLLAATAPATIGGLEVTTVLAPKPLRPAVAAGASAGASTGVAGRAGEMSIEELIDLEQQAEFFVVLGQDEAAIALLDSYMVGDGGKSPLPYLQLLEIHQRRADQAAYERVRAAFNQRFRAYAPDWSSDLHFGRTLEEYPQTVARLQSMWSTPMHAMQALDGLLFRRQSADDTFDFPAYRELLFLYLIARELSGHVETDFGPIDLFLPLDDAPGEVVSLFASRGSAPGSVDLDVSSWTDGVGTGDLVIRRSA